MTFISDRDPSEVVTADLNDEQREFLATALIEWGGAAHCTDAMAIALGFDGVDDLFAQTDSLLAGLRARGPMSRLDWTRILFAAEVILASDVVGLGQIWTAVTGIDDEESWATLRAIQREMTDVRVRVRPVS